MKSFDSSKNLLISAFADDTAGELSLSHGRWRLQWTIFIINFIYLRIFTARCTLVQNAVLPSHVVCLSVCLSVTLVNC